MVHNIKIKWPDPLGRICAANQSYGSSIKGHFVVISRLLNSTCERAVVYNIQNYT